MDGRQRQNHECHLFKTPPFSSLAEKWKLPLGFGFGTLQRVCRSRPSWAQMRPCRCGKPTTSGQLALGSEWPAARRLAYKRSLFVGNISSFHNRGVLTFVALPDVRA